MHVRSEIVYRSTLYVCFWAHYDDGTAPVYCYSDSLAEPRQPEGYRHSVCIDDLEPMQAWLAHRLVNRTTTPKEA